MWLFCCLCCWNSYCTIELYLILLFRDAGIFRGGGLNSDLMWGDPSLLAAFIIYTTKRLGVQVFKG